jgi:outer membrane lipoprotein-sorting protein
MNSAYMLAASRRIYQTVAATAGCALLTGFVSLGTARAQEIPAVDEIVQRANRMAYYQGQDGRANVRMTITDEQQRERNREFIILRRDMAPSADETDQFTGDQKFYVYFLRPADVNKMAFMVWKHIESDDDRWLYYPALDLVKRIAASDKRTSFVGSDFFYEDVSGRTPDDDVHELVETTRDYYVLKNTPKDADLVEFSYYLMWIHKESFIPVKAEYYDKNGNLHRVYEALRVEPIAAFQVVTASRMTNVQTGSSTTLDYSNVEFNVGLEESLFTERYLRKPPRTYLR